MKKIFNFTKKKKHPSGTPDNGSVLSAGYELRDKDLGKAHKAAFQGDLAKLKQLAKKNDLNQLDKENRTPLHIACACGNADVVQFLVENKAKLNLCDNQNRSALMKAVQCQHERCVRILLENHAEPNLVDINGNTALHLASNIPSLSTATLLLQHDADNGAPNQEGFTPLTVAVREDHVEMAEFLLSEGADVNYLDRDQRSPLMMAAGNGQVGMLRLLLRFNADITLKDSKGWSADDYAVMNGHHPCSLLIIEHGTQRRDGPSLSHQGPNKKKKPTLLGSPSQDLGAGFSLEGPATDKDDFEDSSQSESISRVSKSAADEWPSSEDDDESVSVEKKLLKVNLRKLIASKKGEAPALPDRTLSDTESDLESENRAAPSPQRALPSSSALQLPVDPSPVPFLSKAPQMTSTPLPSNVKKEDSTEDDDEYDDDDDEEEKDRDDDDDEEEEEDPSDEESERSEDLPAAASNAPRAEISEYQKKDSFLGLEKGDPEQESWDSESEELSAPRNDKPPSQSQDGNEAAKEHAEETGVHSPRDTKSSHAATGSERVSADASAHKETDKAKWEPFFSKLEEDHKKKTDLMEELGLADVDDLEDTSDWDSASIASKKTLSGPRMASPGHEALQGRSNTPAEKEKHLSPSPPLSPSTSVNNRPVPPPQPCARKTVLQEAEAKANNQQRHTAELPTAAGPGSSELPELTRERESALQPDEQQQKVSKETTRAAHMDQIFSPTLGIDPTATGLPGNEKPRTTGESRKKLSSQPGAAEHELRTATKSVGRSSRSPRATDSSTSDASDDEGRLKTGDHLKNENQEEMEMDEDFDELTQSSGTATDDMDSPTSGYRHASLLIQKLDSVTFDSRSMVKLQNIFHEYERSIQKARSRQGYLSDKVSQLEMERAELKTSLEGVKDDKSALERNQLELQTEITNLKFQLKQEQENGRNATMMYNSSRDKLRRTEEQHQLEVQERQKVELTLRNLELEMRTMVNNKKRLEEEHSQTQRLLAQERSARTMQENLLNSHLRKQQEIEEENKRNMSKSNEALSQLTEASDRERELLQHNSSLQEQLNMVKLDLEHSQANRSIRDRELLEENEALKEQLEDARRDLKLNSDALNQTVLTCNNQIITLKAELTISTNRVENERQARETLAAEAESVRSRLAGAVQEAERSMAALSDAERALLREREEHQRLKDRLSGEASSQREAVNSLSQKLTKEEARANSMENEVHRVTMQLTEKGLLLDVLQREKDQLAVRVKELESSLQAEKELLGRAGSRQEATQERLAQAQSEGMLLRQQLEEVQNKGLAKERAVTDAQERFSDILSELRSDCQGKVQLVEERNKELAAKAADLRDQVYKLEEDRNEREASIRQLQQELADSLKKLAMSEASLEVNTHYRNDLGREKAQLLKDVERLTGKLEESEAQHMQAEKHVHSLKSSLGDREKELSIVAQKHQEALSASAASESTIKQLEEAVQRLEIENARLEAAAKQQSNKLEVLQKGAQEASLLPDSPNGERARGHLEELVADLQRNKMTLEDQLSREVQKQSMLSHTAQDSQALWEEELKSRSKLGLRLAELEKEKGELGTQMEIERKKARKITEQKKAVDSRLEQEIMRNTELQKEMYRQRTLLKAAKKKLQAQDQRGVELSYSVSRHSQDGLAFGGKVGDLQVQLEKEATQRTELEKANRELNDQLASLKSLSRSNDQLERSKRQLEEEVLDLRRRMESTQMEQSQLEQYRRDIEEKARQEIKQKLAEVNLFLQSQAASQEALEQIQAANEANLRSHLEQKIRELEGELVRARSSQHDSASQRDSARGELERYRQLYTEELHLRQSLAAKLDRANSRLSEANSKLLSERSKPLLTGFAGPPLDMSSLGSPANNGASLGALNRSLGLGLSLLSPGSEAPNSRVEDYLARMRSELDRAISQELSSAAAELDVASTRLSPVGSASRELDPVSRAKQDYLEVLKKNYMI